MGSSEEGRQRVVLIFMCQWPGDTIQHNKWQHADRCNQCLVLSESKQTTEEKVRGIARENGRFNSEVTVVTQIVLVVISISSFLYHENSIIVRRRPCGVSFSRLIHTYHAVVLPCRGLEKSLAKRIRRSTAGARHGMCESNTVALCYSNVEDAI